LKIKELKIENDNEPTDEENEIFSKILETLEGKQDEIKMKIFSKYKEATEEEINNAGNIIEYSIINFSKSKDIQENLDEENTIHEENLQLIIKGKNPDNVKNIENITEYSHTSNDVDQSDDNCKIEEIDDI